MNIEEIKKRIKNKEEDNKYKPFFIKFVILMIIFLLSIILLNKNKTFKTWFNNNVIEKNISFETVKKTYTKYFGSVLPFEKLMKTEPVFNEKLNYTELNKFENGISLTVENNYLVPVQYSGIVVFVGEKKPYGNTVIIESDNVTIWYSNIDTSNIKVYDHVEKGKYLGETLNNKLYLVFKKEGNFVDYKVYIHPLLYFLGLISILTGLFKSFLIMYLIVLTHELGHITIGIIFKYDIKQIKIYPFGGYTIFNTNINKSFIEEFLVFIGGILFQTILYLLVKTFMNPNLYSYNIFMNYNTTILLFNLLPIIPLDGSKVLNILLNTIIPFKKSHILTIYISFVSVFILIILYYKDINMIMMSILLIIMIRNEYKNHLFLYNSFLIERYIKNIKFKKNHFIRGNNINKIMKYFNNTFILNNKYVDEKEVLRKKFSSNKPTP